MTLRHALLALLSSAPMTGYDVAKKFASSVGHVWHAANSQIYPELRKMEREGLVDTRDVPWGSKGETKTEYAINDRGLQALREWQREPMAYVADRDPARLKAAYLEWGTPESAESFLREHISHFKAQRRQALDEMKRIEAGMNPTLVRRLEDTPEAAREKVTAFKRFAYEGRVLQAEAEIEWAERGLEMLEKLTDLPGPPADGVAPGGD
ncbi:helix-turn-helix transcriptional regulator [Corynebacterium comes]|uniref:Transcriptional regulator PadR-like family protein n=1 Tax=Corynebacterium comes TaxID=2675218 RepID=A0A6B8VTT8_9CORY|nr:helix-turn-helix transcriptional regulator [Corynebacterium comes]QGU04794.1 Transcriptional regulator PadR-like family protein [Corynebacterium comes]